MPVNDDDDNKDQSEYREVVRQIRECQGWLPSRCDQEWAASGFSSARFAVQQREEEQRRREARGSKRKRDCKQPERIRGLVQGEDPNKSAFWMLMEEYYRDVTKEDIDFLISCHDEMLDDPAFKIPALGCDSTEESRSSKLGSARKRVDRLHSDAVYYDTKGLQKRGRGKSSNTDAPLNTIEQFENPLLSLDQEQLMNYLRLGHQLGTLKTDLLPDFQSSQLPPKQWLQEHGLKQILDQSLLYLQTHAHKSNCTPPSQQPSQLVPNILTQQNVMHQQDTQKSDSQQKVGQQVPQFGDFQQQQNAPGGSQMQQQDRQQINISNVPQSSKQVPQSDIAVSDQKQNNKRVKRMFDGTIKDCVREISEQISLKKPPKWIQQTPFEFNGEDLTNGADLELNGQKIQPAQKFEDEALQILRGKFGNLGQKYLQGGLQIGDLKIQEFDCSEIHPMLQSLIQNSQNNYTSQIENPAVAIAVQKTCDKDTQKLAVQNLNNLSWQQIQTQQQQQQKQQQQQQQNQQQQQQQQVSSTSKKIVELDIQPQNLTGQTQNDVQIKLSIMQNGIQEEAEGELIQQKEGSEKSQLQQGGDLIQQQQQYQSSSQQQIGREEDWQQLRSSIPELINAADDEISNELLILQFQLYHVMKSNQQKSVKLLQRVQEVLPEQRKLRQLQEAEEKDIMAYVDKSKEMRRYQKRQRRAQAQNDALVQLSEGGTGGLIRTRSAAGIIKTQRHPYGMEEEEEEQEEELEGLEKEGEEEEEEEDTVHSEQLSEELLQQDQLIDQLAMSVPGDDVDDRKCCVCGDGGSKPPNQIVFCDRCDMGVHQQCYGGLRELPGECEDWLCCPCSDLEQQLKEEGGQSIEQIKQSRLQSGQKGSMNVTCCLCPVKGGAFKKTFNARCWAHLVCGFYCKGVHLKLDRGTNCVDTSRIHRYGTQHCCRYCGKSTGGIPRCGFTNCQVHCHPICNRIAGGALLKKNHPSKGWQYRVYCKAHVLQGQHWADTKERTPPNKSVSKACVVTPIVVGDQVNVETQLERLELCKSDLEEAQKVIEVVVKREELKGKILTGFTHLVQGALADVQAFQHEVAALLQQVDEEEKQKGNLWCGHNATSSLPSSENKCKQQRASSNRSRRKRKPNPPTKQQSKSESALEKQLHRTQELIVEARPNGKQSAKLELDESQEPLNLGVNEALTTTRGVMGKQFVYVSMDQVGQQVQHLP